MNNLATATPYIEESFELDTTPDAVTLLATFDKLSGSFGAYAGDIRAKMDEVMLMLENMDKDEARMKLRRMNRTLVSIAELERYEKSGANIYGLSKPQELSIMGTIPFLVESLGQDAPAGSIILPTGQGKTRIAVVFREITKGKVIYIAHDSNGISQMLNECKKVKTSGTCGTITKDSKNSEYMVVTSFEAFKKAVIEKRIDPSTYDAIMVDEADVNGLSKLRVDFLSNLQKSTGVPVTALSATEHQASGRKLEDYYKYKILNLPMPQSLPDLCRKGLLPKTKFSDIYLNADFYVNKKDLANGLQDEVLDRVLEKQTAWFQGMVKYHKEHHDGKPCMFAFRNNKFNELFLAEAAKADLKLASFTGEETRDEREALKLAFQKGELHGLIGSRMIGRGLDLANCKVVYNSLLTYSPQLFWQLAGRGLRLDPENTEKQAELVSFLPLHLYDAETQEEFDMKRFPLSFGAFLDRAKIENRANWAANRQNMAKLRVVNDGKPKEYDLEDLQETDFVTMNEMTQYLNQLDAYGSYQGRPEKIAEMILANTKNLTFQSLMFILKMRGIHVNEFIEREAGGITPTFSQEVLSLPIVQSYLKQTEKLEQLTMERENELRASKDYHTLLVYHYPILIALAQKYAEQKDLPFEDVLQIGLESLLTQMSSFEGIQNRFASWICIKSFSSMLKIGNDNYFKYMYVPGNMAIIAKKVEHLVEDIQKNRQNPLSRDKVLEQIKEAFPDLTKGTRERALDIIERQYISIEDHPEILEEVAYDQETMGNEGYIEDPSKLFDQVELQNVIKEVVQSLEPENAEFLKLLYGLDGEEELSLGEVASRLNMRRETLRQRELKTLLRLRYPSKSFYLGLFADYDRGSYKNVIDQRDFYIKTSLEKKKDIDDLIEKIENNSISGKDLIGSIRDLDFWRERSRYEQEYVYGYGYFDSQLLQKKIYFGNFIMKLFEIKDTKLLNVFVNVLSTTSKNRELDFIVEVLRAKGFNIPS